MAKTEKLENQEVVQEVDESKVQFDEVNVVGYPLKREEYYDKKNDKTMFSYFVQEELVLNGVTKYAKIKITCSKKDIDMFETVNMLFDIGCTPMLIRKNYELENEKTGEKISGYQYFVRVLINGLENDLQVALMKASDKFIADLLFNYKK